MNLFDPEVLDRLEGLNERYRVLGERIVELEGRINDAASFDLPPDTEALGALVDKQLRVRDEAAAPLREVLALLNSRFSRPPLSFSSIRPTPAGTGSSSMSKIGC